MRARTGRLTTATLGIALGVAATLALALFSGSAGAAQERLTQGPDRLTGYIGAGVGLVPVYEGADDYKFLALPVFDLRYGEFYINFRDGAGVDLINTKRFEAGVGATYVRGRRAKDSPEGVGKVKNAIGGRGFARYYFTEDLTLAVGLTHSFGGTDGTLADLTLGYKFRPSKQLMLMPAVSATWANGKHMRRYFGINAQQADRSGLPRFEADGGIKDVSASLGAIYSLSREWHVSVGGGLSYYLGDAADSPINERTWQPAVFLGVAYRF